MEDKGKKPAKRQKRSGSFSNAKNTVLNESRMYDIEGNAQWNLFYIGTNGPGQVGGEESSKSHQANGTLKGMDLADGSHNNISSQMQGHRNMLRSTSNGGVASESETEVISPSPPGPEVMAVSLDMDAHASTSATWRTHDCDVLPIDAYASRAEMYTIMMLTHKAGYPLYMPEPHGGLATAYRKTGVQIGDVGVVTPNGAFDFLFNACGDSLSTNPAQLPDGFEALKAEVAVNIKFKHDTHLTSTHVNEVRDRKPTFAFQCLAAEGAVLALPEGATVYEALNRFDFQKHAARHAVNWYKYMLERGRDSSNGSLYFVTECVKSRNWGIAAFYGKSMPSDYLYFMPLELERRVAQAPYHWDHCGKVEPRIGPTSMDIVIADDDEPNQCIFLRGFKIMLRQDIWDKLRNPICVSSRKRRFSEMESSERTGRSARNGSYRSQNGTSATGNRGTSADDKGYRRERSATQRTEAEPSSIEADTVKVLDFGQVILEENVSIPSPAHPSDLINEMLLRHHSTAKAAVTHDREWCESLPSELFSDPERLKFDGLLENIEQLYSSMVNEHGCAILVNSNIEQSTTQNNLSVHDCHDSGFDFVQPDLTNDFYSPFIPNPSDYTIADYTVITPPYYTTLQHRTSSNSVQSSDSPPDCPLPSTPSSSGHISGLVRITPTFNIIDFDPSESTLNVTDPAKVDSSINLHQTTSLNSSVENDQSADGRRSSATK